jgi:FkbM family methyltransferase
MLTLSGLLKIEYIHQPKYLFRRIVRQLTGDFSKSKVAAPMEHRQSNDFDLPWGLKIEANPEEEHGKILQTLGVIDLVVTESIWRLLEPNSTFLDVGANIGYMTSVAIARLESFPESRGKAIAYEPHPDIYANFLQRNTDRWSSQANRTQITLHQIALSDRNGSTLLSIPIDFAGNQGLAQVVHPSDDPDRFSSLNSNNQNAVDVAAPLVDRLSIQCQRLDDCLPSNEIVNLMKIDVEGHELAVFKGALKCLQEQRIHHIIFEAHDGYPSELTNLLETYGYTIFGIDRQFFGPRLVAPGSDSDAVKWLPRNYIATSQPSQVISAFSQRGWQIFK